MSIKPSYCLPLLPLLLPLPPLSLDLPPLALLKLLVQLFDQEVFALPGMLVLQPELQD
jgi:hypothetical protein